ncbi:MAG: peptide ABC transporter substrate-binding protein [Deltaproteobacteria bacterium]|nr:peptide ABC transporter substrate-binding protein [Deltaproteobacteria bacterium]
MRARAAAGFVVAALAVFAAATALLACRREDGPAGEATNTTTTAPPTTTTTTTTAGVKRLTLGVTSEPSSLCPLFSDGAATAEVQGLVFRELVQSTPQGKTGDLATRVPTLGDDARLEADGTFVVDWTLRPDARWSDGTPVTARDVVAGWKVAVDPAQATTGGRDLAQKIARIDVVDDHRFRVVWRAPEPAFADVRTHRVLPAHRVLQHDGAPRDLARDPFCRRPVGNGPFVVVDVQPGAFVRLRRSPQFLPRPLLDDVVVKIVPSTDALAAALVAGDVDASLGHGGLSPTEAARLVAAHDGALVALRAPGTTWVHLDFNLDDPVLKDVRVRRALALAIDRRALVQTVADDAFDVDEGFFPRHHPLRVALPALPFDPAAARRLLDEAGFVAPAPGAVREDARPGGTGAPLRLQLAAASGQRETERALQLVQAALRDVGVDVVLDLRPFKVFFAEGAKKRRLPHLSFYAWVVDESTSGANLWRADRIPSADNGFTGQNLPGWRDDEVTRLLAEADASVDVAVRQRNLERVQQRFVQDVPALSFWFRPAVVVARRGISGLAPTGTLSPLAWNAATWDVAAPP